MKNKFWRILIISAAILIIAIVSSLMVLIGLAPVNSLNDLKNEIAADSIYSSQYDSLYNQVSLTNIVKEKAYKSALLSLSNSDSIQLAIQLSDSTVCLYLKGVKLHQTKIFVFQKDAIIQNLPMREYLYCFSKPIPILGHRASIVKEPIVERHAPKDTIEAALNAYNPDTLIQNPAFVELFLPHHINLVFLQSENDTLNFKQARTEFLNEIRNRQLYLNLQQILNKQKTTQNPSITIELPADDLRAIYRALPYYGLVVIGY